ncbi:unnamed protein product, partial [Allacma fusca]
EDSVIHPRGLVDPGHST